MWRFNSSLPLAFGLHAARALNTRGSARQQALKAAQATVETLRDLAKKDRPAGMTSDRFTTNARLHPFANGQTAQIRVTTLIDGVPHEWAHAQGPSDLVKRSFEGEVSHTEFEQELFKRCI